MGNLTPIRVGMVVLLLEMLVCRLMACYIFFPKRNNEEQATSFDTFDGNFCLKFSTSTKISVYLLFKILTFLFKLLVSD